jgi:hypothetical protein
MNTKPNKEQAPKFLFQVGADGSIDPRPAVRGSAVVEIPKGVYSVAYEKDRGLYLRPENDFYMPDRIYGQINPNVDRFLRSYELNDKNLGVMLIGEAGSGKTLTLKAVGQKANELDMPVILVNDPYPGDALVYLLSTITQPVVVCFDEFDKVYGPSNEPNGQSASDRQRSILQLLDGTATGAKKLFIFSANNEEQISKYLKDRPSRVRYTIKFKRLELATVVEYVSANLKDCTDEHIHAFTHLALSDGGQRGWGAEVESNGLNFDSMRELVTEMNQFGGSVNDNAALMMGNGSASCSAFEVGIYKDGVLLRTGLANGTFKGSYVGQDECVIPVKSMLKDEVSGSKKNDTVELTKEHFVSFGADFHMLEFRKDGVDYYLRYVDHKRFVKGEEKLGQEQHGFKIEWPAPQAMGLRHTAATDRLAVAVASAMAPPSTN